MEEKSINLCGKRGVEVFDLLHEKVRNPLSDLELTVGKVVLSRIKRTSHSGDGKIVIEAATPDTQPPDYKLFTFEFAPDYSLFRDTAMGADGETNLCDE